MTTNYGAFQEARFRSNVEKALQQVQSILDTTRHPRLIDTSTTSSGHTYDDKYLLAETLTNTSLACLRTALQRLGVTDEQWKQWLTWSQEQNKTVTLRFEASDSCSLLKETVVEMEDPTATETTTTTTSSSWMSSSTTTTKVMRKIKEAHWKVGALHTLTAFCGNETDHAVTIAKRESSTLVVIGGGNATTTSTPTSGGTTPRDSIQAPIPANTEHAPIDLNLTWFLQQLQASNETESSNGATTAEAAVVTCQFAIDRSSATTCKTPRRNDDITKALEFHHALQQWMYKVETYFTKRIEGSILGQHKPVMAETAQTLTPGTVCQLQNITKEPKFNGKQVVIKEFVQSQDRYRVEPLLAADGLPTSLLVKGKDLAKDTTAGNANSVKSVSAEGIFMPVQPLLEDGAVFKDIPSLLQGHDKALNDVLAKQAKIYPPKQVPKMLTLWEATVVLVCRHVQNVAQHYQDCVKYLEHLLYQQVVQAIGKQVTPEEFTNFMRFHGRRLLGASYAPRPFSYAIRRPGHAPDGVLSIEADDVTPIDSMVRHVPPDQHAAPLQIPLDAATTVPMTGDWYLHGWLLHQFAEHEIMRPPSFSLSARARQFSSFLLVIGTMAGAHRLDPKHAIILQNKDDLLIPLLTEVLPSAKDFKDAISSLSPEQQDFCKAFRAMQLESSVFGVAVIQLKPQLEKLLGLSAGSLTKEIQLTQDLMSLFIEYQIPSDLLSFDGPDDAPRADRLAAVKEHVKAVLTVISSEKEKTITTEEQRAEYREAAAAPKPPAEIPSPIMYKHSAAAFPARASGSPIMRKMGMSARAQMSPMKLGLMSHSTRMTEMAESAPSPLPPPAAAASVSNAFADESAVAAEPPSSETMVLPTGTASSAEDFTMLPKELDTKLETLDTDNALHSTVLKAGTSWTLQRQENLLTKSKVHHFGLHEINQEKKKAFDLLDAISRSGSLPIEAAELHVIVALSHCFEKDLMGTVVEDNINPIAKAERSALLLASTVHRLAPSELLASDQDTRRLKAAFPLLFDK